MSPSAARSSGESGHAAISAVGLPAAPPRDLSTFPPAKEPTKPHLSLGDPRAEPWPASRSIAFVVALGAREVGVTSLGALDRNRR